MSRPGTTATVPPDHRGMARAIGYLYACAPLTYALWDVAFSAGSGGLALQGATALVGIAAAVVLLSGRLDRSPLVVLEAALAGLPVLLAASASAAVVDGGPAVGFGLVAWSVPVAFACLDRVRAWRQALWACAASASGLVVLGTVGPMAPRNALGSAVLVTVTVLGLAVVTLWLRGREAVRAAQQRVLAEFGRRALAETDVARLLDDAVATAATLVPGDVAMLLAYHRAEGEFELAAVRSSRPETPAAGFRFTALPGRPSWLTLTCGEPFVISERATDPRFPLAPPWDDRFVSAVLVPIPGPDGTWGVLRVQSHVRQEYTREDAAVLTGLATLVAGVLERVRTAERHAEAAVHDALTGLPNRRWAMEELTRLLLAGERDLAVVMLDLDDFRDVNDALGHSSGDELLRATGARVAALLRPGQTVARLDGDAFVVVARGIAGDDGALELARRLADAWQEPFDVDGRRHHLSASAGVALPAGPPPTTSAAGERAAVSLLGDAATARYRARQRGRGQVELYDARLRAWSVRRMELESDLRRAMRAREFSVEYQPVVEARTGRPVGVEALARWHSPRRGTVEPAEFVPAAERLGLIVPLGAWVLEEAARTVAQWQRAGITGPGGVPLQLAVNVSPVQLADPDLASLVARVVDTSGLLPGSLGLEVTEGVLLEDLDEASAALRALVAAGAQILLDDFGTGHSSLAYLHRFPLRKVKLDRSFVARLGSHPPADAIVGAVVQMAATLGLEVVAEGVETPDQRAAVLEHGVGLVQGDGIAPAMPGPVVLDWLATAIVPPEPPAVPAPARAAAVPVPGEPGQKTEVSTPPR